jgi:enamine deaminase RidA (YjgF/YER057c/UK114 family)
VSSEELASQSPEDRLTRLGLSLPPAGPPLASYVPMVVARGLAFVSGHGPLGPDRRPAFVGRVGTDLSTSDAVAAAQLTAMNIIATLRQGLGTLNVISQLVELRCFLVADPSSAAHLEVPRAVADVFESVFGPHAGGAQTTIGINASVLGLPITVDVIALIQG